MYALDMSGNPFQVGDKVYVAHSRYRSVVFAKAEVVSIGPRQERNITEVNPTTGRWEVVRVEDMHDVEIRLLDSKRKVNRMNFEMGRVA